MEAKLSEALARLINIELKIDRIISADLVTISAVASGHPDQGFGGRTYAQFGEDLIFLNIFSLLGIDAPSYIDIGAHHPLNISNTALLYERGCRGINIEANPDLMPDFDRLRPEDINLNVGIGPTPGKFDFYRFDQYSGRNTFDRKNAEDFITSHPEHSIKSIVEVEVITLNDVVNRYRAGRFPNLLNIDAEGLDYDILASADFAESRPEVICAEFISGGDVDDSSRLSSLLHSHGYQPYFKTWGNLIYVTAEVLSGLRGP